MTLPNDCKTSRRPMRPATTAASVAPSFGSALAVLASTGPNADHREITEALHHARRRSDELLALQKAQMHRLLRKGQPPPRALLRACLRRWKQHKLQLLARAQARAELSGLLLPPSHHTTLKLEHELRLQLLQNWLRERLIEALVVHSVAPSPPAMSGASSCSSGGAPLKYTRRRLPTAAKAVLTSWFEKHTDHPYPTDQEKTALAKACSVGFDQVGTWFINARARKWPHKRGSSTGGGGPTTTAATAATTAATTAAAVATAAAAAAAAAASAGASAGAAAAAGGVLEQRPSRQQPPVTTGLRTVLSRSVAAGPSASGKLRAVRMPLCAGLPRLATADVGSVARALGRLSMSAPLPRMLWRETAERACTPNSSSSSSSSSSGGGSSGGGGGDSSRRTSPGGGRRRRQGTGRSRCALHSSVQVRLRGSMPRAMPRLARRTRSEGHGLAGLLATAPAAIMRSTGRHPGHQSTA